MEIRIETETLSLWLAVCILSSLATSGVRVKCKDALEMCSSVSGCKMGMSNYQRNCRDVMEGEINYCSTKCRESLVALIIADTESSKYGKNVADCVCTDRFCKKAKQNVLNACNIEVNRTLSTIEINIQTCSQAKAICLADTFCQFAYNYYTEFCGFAIETCTSKCKRAARILYQQPSARFLRQCKCGRDAACTRDRQFLEISCWGMHRRKVTSAPNSSSGDRGVNGDPANGYRIASASVPSSLIWLTVVCLLAKRFTIQ